MYLPGYRLQTGTVTKEKSTAKSVGRVSMAVCIRMASKQTLVFRIHVFQHICRDLKV